MRAQNSLFNQNTCDSSTVGNSYRYLGTPTFDGRYLGTLDVKGLHDLLHLRYPGTHTFDLERGT